MAQYGEFLEEDNIKYGEILDIKDPEKEKIYQEFDKYFNHPIMTKVKDVEGCSMYMAKIYCMIGIGCRYIVATVYQDNKPVKNVEKLKNLNWITLQTRTLTDNYNVNTHTYQPARDGYLKIPIHKTNVTKEASTYNCKDSPITVTLLHDNKKDEDYKLKYSNQGNIIIALETYNTIITIE